MMENIESKISCVIPTFNRCPHKKIEYNPIWWATSSLFRQNNLDEIIFIDDGSEDYFFETVKRIQDIAPSNVNVKYLRNENREGSGKSRNMGVDIAVNDSIFFMDDDCFVVGDYVLPNLSKAFNFLKQEGIKVGVMSLPVSSDSLEHEVVPKSKIGKLERDTGIMHGVYMRFPREFIENPSYLNIHSNLFTPLEIEFTGGVFLSDKKAFQEVGGFPTTKWRNASAEEPELMFNMKRNGYKIFYLPSLDKMSCVFHFRYGDPFRERFKNHLYPFSVEGISIEEMLSCSLEDRIGSGNRVNKKEAEYSTFLSRIRLVFKWYEDKDGLNYLQTTHSELKNDYGKLKIFKRAVQDGLDIMREEEIISSNISEKIKQKYLY